MTVFDKTVAETRNESDAPRSLGMTAPLRAGRRAAAWLVGGLILAVLGLLFVPWQQSIIGYGAVAVFTPMDRPQNIEAQIPGRLVEWKVQEGQTVKAGQVIGRIEDTDSKFLDPEQPLRVAEQKAALLQQKERVRNRVARLTDQYKSLTASREAALSAARQKVAQAKQKRVSTEQSLVAARKSFQIAESVSQQQAREKLQQAKDKLLSAEQAVEAAKQNLVTARLQRERIGELYKKGLRSRRDDELAQNDLVKNETEVRKAELARDVARRDTGIGALDQERAGIEIERARTSVTSAEANLDIAERDVLTAELDRAKLATDTAGSLSSLEASLESARESVAKVDADLAKLAVDQRNIERRVDQQVVVVPRDGVVVSLQKVGEGATVKSGDVLAVVAPETTDRSVELRVIDNDIPLVRVGSPVRLQFAGWPAVQFAGFPSVGTFAGRVAVIDAVDDGTSRYRVVVRPDETAIASGEEQAWPDPTRLRPGAKATGWILLNTVPLWQELWRQFNAFPPMVPAGSSDSGKDGKGSKDSGNVKSDGKKSYPYFEIKPKK